MKQINNSSQVETTNIDDENYVILELDANNIAKISLQIIYLKEHGFKNFLISYNFKNIEISVTKVLAKLKIDYLLGLAKEYGFKFKFKGFSRCIYEKYILKPELRRFYENQVGFVEDDCENGNKVNRYECNLCLFNDKCNGVCEGYLNNFGEKEFSPLIANKDLYDLNSTELETFTNTELIDIGKIILEDYKAENLYLRKKFGFVVTFYKEYKQEFQENFVYQIYNREDDFEKTYDLISKFYDNTFLELIKDYITISNQLTLNFALDENKNMIKRFNFSIYNLNLNQITSLAKLLNVDIKTEKSPHAVIVEFKDDKIKIAVSYSNVKATIIELKSFVKDITLENKRLFLKYSNSLIKPLNYVFYDYIYSNDNKLYSKRVNVSLKHNSYRFTQFYTLFKIPLNFFEGKSFDILTFEIKNNGEEKINFYYTLELPQEEMVEEDEGN